jgi:trk system potassium uptake protein TrkH
MDLRFAIRRSIAALRVPQAIPAAGFLAVILVGSALLSLPWSHSGTVGYLDALFTSTSAVCVTGLVTVNTSADYTVTGQVVIIILIQIGGLGVMTYAAMALSVLRRRLSLRTQAALHDSLFQKDEARDFKRRFRQIIVITLAVEAVGALVLFLALLPSSEGGPAAWRAVFHSVSAFCNAGFSIFPANLVEIRGNHLFTAMIMVLIVLGGLGFTVLHELTGEGRRILGRSDRQRPRRFSLHTNVVLRTSLALIIGGAALMLLFGMTGAEQSWGQRIEAALFQSISARTSGFNTIDVAALPVASLLVLAALMFIGGSPASCAGGVKTSSLAVMFARIRSYITGEEEARLMGRKLNRDLIRSAGLLFVLALAWNIVGLFVLAHFEKARAGVELQHLLFEQISAFGTVGLSTGTTTAGLSIAGKIWIIATMYVGRLGPLTLVSLAIYRRTSRVTFPEGKVMIG